MKEINRPLLTARIHEARTQLASAEGELEEALQEIQTAPRADKTHIGQRLGRALGALKAARQNVSDLDTLLDPTA